MSQAIHQFHFPALFQDTGKRLLNYGPVVVTALSIYLVFGALTLGSLVVLVIPPVMLKVKADKVANMVGQDLNVIPRTEFVDGGAFQRGSDEKTVIARTIVLDGGSFERSRS